MFYCLFVCLNVCMQACLYERMSVCMAELRECKWAQCMCDLVLYFVHLCIMFVCWFVCKYVCMCVQGLCVIWYFILHVCALCFVCQFVSMYVCVYACMLVCMRVLCCIYLYFCMHACMYVYVYMYVCLYVCIYPCMHVRCSSEKVGALGKCRIWCYILVWYSISTVAPTSYFKYVYMYLICFLCVCLCIAIECVNLVLSCI